MSYFPPSELILNPDGSILHLKLHPGQVADTAILVGDPGRVELVSSLLDRQESLSSNREFKSVTGYFNGQKILVLSTGIGSDNMDIVVNELDALVNIDLNLRTEKVTKKSLRLIRLGTSGALQPDIPVGKCVAAAWSIGLDGLLPYYVRPDDPERQLLENELKQQLSGPQKIGPLYAARCGNEYLSRFNDDCLWGITVAAHGFYGPQGRLLRAGLRYPDMNASLAGFKYKDQRISNFEMESSALYGLSEILGHSALTVCLIIANRARKEYIGDYHEPMRDLAQTILERVTTL
jgi:uridine phosphorylase